MKTAEETVVNQIINIHIINSLLYQAAKSFVSARQDSTKYSRKYIPAIRQAARTPGSHWVMFVDYFQLHDHKVINRLE